MAVSAVSSIATAARTERSSHAVYYGCVSVRQRNLRDNRLGDDSRSHTTK